MSSAQLSSAQSSLEPTSPRFLADVDDAHLWRRNACDAPATLYQYDIEPQTPVKRVSECQPTCKS